MRSREMEEQCLGKGGGGRGPEKGRKEKGKKTDIIDSRPPHSRPRGRCFGRRVDLCLGQGRAPARLDRGQCVLLGLLVCSGFERKKERERERGC